LDAGQGEAASGSWFLEDTWPGSTKLIRIPMELHLAVVVRPGSRDVVRLDPDRDEQRSALEHAGQDALAALKP
jgi:hypothetical protein